MESHLQGKSFWHPDGIMKLIYFCLQCFSFLYFFFVIFFLFFLFFPATRVSAEQMMDSAPPNTFLIRPSSNPNCLALSHKISQDNYGHALIQYTGNGFALADQGSKVHATIEVGWCFIFIQFEIFFKNVLVSFCVLCFLFVFGFLFLEIFGFFFSKKKLSILNKKSRMK